MRAEDVSLEIVTDHHGVFGRDSKVFHSERISVEMPTVVRLNHHVRRPTPVLRVSRRAEVLGLLGVLSMLWTASVIFSSLEHAMGVVFRVPQPRNFLKGRLLAISMVPASALFFLLSFSVTALSGALQEMAVPRGARERAGGRHAGHDQVCRCDGDSADSDKDANPDEKPQHTVQLDEYLIGRYEVTMAQTTSTKLGNSYKEEP